MLGVNWIDDYYLLLKHFDKSLLTAPHIGQFFSAKWHRNTFLHFPSKLQVWKNETTSHEMFLDNIKKEKDVYYNLWGHMRKRSFWRGMQNKSQKDCFLKHRSMKKNGIWLPPDVNTFSFFHRLCNLCIEMGFINWFLK